MYWGGIDRGGWGWEGLLGVSETTDGLESFMKWFPTGRVVNDIMGRWHGTPKSRVPVDVCDCARGSIGRLVRFFAQCPCPYPALVLVLV